MIVELREGSGVCQCMKFNFIRYNPKLKEYARSLRNKSTPGEIALWKKVRAKQIQGYDFHRQKPIGEYIVDFFCPELMLAIEIDGISHDNKKALVNDAHRQRDIEKLGITVLRFTEEETLKNTGTVVEQIEYWIKTAHP